MYCIFISLLIASLCKFTQAVYIHPDGLCFYACTESVGYVYWKGIPTGEGYYKKYCEDNLQTRSAFLCARHYCTPEETQIGHDYVNNDVCEAFGANGAGFPLVPMSIVSNYTKGEIEKMKRFGTADVFVTIFNHTAIPDQAYFDDSYRTVKDFEGQMGMHELYGWAMYAFWGAVIAISLCFKFFAFVLRKSKRNTPKDPENNNTLQKQSSVRRVFSGFTTYLATSATFGGRCAEPYWWCTVPPLIQSLTIFAFVGLNLIVCCVNYTAFPTNIYWSSKTIQIWRYVSDRTGIICFANLPLLWAFGTRNNILLWLTGWEFSTFNNFHRWVARVATLEAVIHSIGYTVQSVLQDDLALEYVQNYWYNGVIATICMSFMIGFSIYGLRRYAYEFFLLTHIGFGVVIIVTLFNHVAIYYGQYNGYLWAVTAIWCFDRVARLTRIVILNGKFFTGKQSAMALYSESSETIFLDVPMSVDFKVGAGNNYYLYLLHGWKFWESHPFTATSILHDSGGRNLSVSGEDVVPSDKVPTTTSVEKADSTLSIQSNRIRFVIRPYGGFTKTFRRLLADTAPGKPKPVRVLLEGPYGHAGAVKNFDNNVLIIGGSGITAALAHLESTVRQSGDNPPSIRLHWSVRHIAAFEEFREELAALCCTLDAKITVYVTREPENEVEKVKARENIYPSGWSVQYGRMNVPHVIQQESDDGIGSIAVVGCGPARMMDLSRAAVVRLAFSHGKDVRYFQETFGW